MKWVGSRVPLFLIFLYSCVMKTCGNGSTGDLRRYSHFVDVRSKAIPNPNPNKGDAYHRFLQNGGGGSLRSVAAFISSESNCSGAIDPKLYQQLYESMSGERNALRSLIDESSKSPGNEHVSNSSQFQYIFSNSTQPVLAMHLKLLNAGSGTTGTGGLKKILCNDLHLRSIHHMDRCESGQRLPGHINRLVAWKSELLCCLGYADANYHNHQKHQRRCQKLQSRRGPECSALRILQKLEDAMHQAVIDRPLEALSDSPADFLFPELFALSPHALVIQSVREPHMWARKRIHFHERSEIICRENLWQVKEIRHPFDVLRCMMMGGPDGQIGDYLLTFPQYNNSLSAIAGQISVDEKNVTRHQKYLRAISTGKACTFFNILES